MGKIIDTESLLRQLDDRPMDGRISIQALRAMIDSAEEADLKEEARKQGYSLHKIQKYIPLMPCPVCGKRPRQWITNMGTVWYGCADQRTESLKHDKMAREAWNRMVSDE